MCACVRACAGREVVIVEVEGQEEELMLTECLLCAGPTVRALPRLILTSALGL